MKIAFTPMPVSDQLKPATTFFRKLQSRNNELLSVSPLDPKPVGRLASLTILPGGEKAFPLGLAGENGRRFGRCLGKKTLCEGLFWDSEGTSKEAEIERWNGKVIYWLGSSTAIVSLLVGMLYLWESAPPRAVGFDQPGLARESRQIQGEITLGQALQALRTR
jgi:hypothetical protein